MDPYTYIFQAYKLGAEQAKKDHRDALQAALKKRLQPVGWREQSVAPAPLAKNEDVK